MKPVLRLLAFSAIMTVLVISLVPVGMAPLMFRPTVWEQGLVFAVLAGLVSLAFPDRPLGLAIGLVVFIVVAEALQIFIPGRLGSVLHVLAKMAGASMGIAAGQLIYWLTLRFWPEEKREE